MLFILLRFLAINSREKYTHNRMILERIVTERNMSKIDRTIYFNLRDDKPNEAAKIKQVLHIFKDLLHNAHLYNSYALAKFRDEVSGLFAQPDTGSYKIFAKYCREIYEIVFSVFKNKTSHDEACEVISVFMASLQEPIIKCKTTSTKDFLSFLFENLKETCEQALKSSTSSDGQHLKPLLMHFVPFFQQIKDRSLAKPIIDLVITLTMFEGCTETIEIANRYFNKNDFFNFKILHAESLTLTKRVFQLALKVDFCLKIDNFNYFTIFKMF